MRNEIIQQYGYPSVWMTSNDGDNPHDLRQAITADNMTELTEIAREHGGEIVLLQRICGRSYYQNRGRFWHDSLIEVEPSGDKTKVTTIWENSEDQVNKYLLKGFDSWGEYITHRCDSSELDDILGHLKRIVTTRNNMLACVDADYITAIVMDDSDDIVLFSVNEEDTSYWYDSTEYRLAVELV